MNTKRIVVFDGVCSFCARSVQFIIKHDPEAMFKFAPVQSKVGKELLAEYGLSPENAETLLLIKEKKLFTKSGAALEIAKELNGLWNLFVIFSILPKNVRDWIYSKAAKNRYKWFGKREHCFRPTGDIKERFLD